MGQHFLRKRRFGRIALGLALSALSCCAAQAEIRYAFTDLAAPGITGFNARAINAFGQVTGSAETTVNVERAFLWTPEGANSSKGSIYDLGTLDGASTAGYGINSMGQVTGTTMTGLNHAFLWTPAVPQDQNGTMKNLGAVIGTFSQGIAINERGQVTGNGFTNPILWSPTMPNATTGSMVGLTVGSAGGFANAINRLGQVVGGLWSTSAQNSDRPFLWSPNAPNSPAGTATALGTIRGAATGINDYGQVVGVTTSGAFLWTPAVANGASGTMINLGTLGGNAIPYGINSSGTIVGESAVVGASPTHRAFHYTGATGMLDLNTLVDPTLELVLETASAVNDAGQIVGQAWDGQRTHAFLLTPLMRGDFDGDLEVTPLDIRAMLRAFLDLDAYQSARGFTDGEFLAMADVNKDLSIDNRDIQPLLNLLAGIETLPTVVPEPSSLCLVALAIASACAFRHRHRRSADRVSSC